MKRDEIVLGQGYILDGEDLPNFNALIVGISGAGKSLSVVFPTVSRMENANPVLSYAKETDAYYMAEYLKMKGYNVHVLNIVHPDRSTIGFDPIMFIQSFEDIDSLAADIIDSVLRKTADDYWQAKAKPLLKSLITASLMLESDNKSIPRMVDVLRLFDQLIPHENGYSVETPLDSLFERIEIKNPGCYACREYTSWHSLPYRTASCVRDTLAAALSTVFPEPIRKMMGEKPQFDVQKFVQNKEALIVITSAMESSQQYYGNLFYRNIERQLLRYAATCPNGELPREVRYIFDDFACTAPIRGWACELFANETLQKWKQVSGAE